MWHKSAVFVTLSTWGVLLGAILLQGAPTCPTLEEVRQALASLLPVGEQSDAPVQVELVSRGAVLEMTLTNGKGDVEAQKVISVRPPCGRAAEQVAVVIALWDAQLDSGIDLSLPDGQLLDPPASAPPPLAAQARRAPPVAARNIPTWGAEALVGAMLARTSDSFAPALGGALRLYPRRNRLGVVGSMVWIDEHEQRFKPTPGAQVHWQQLWIGLGPSLAQTWGRWRLLADVQFNTGFNFLRGSGFDRNLSARSLELGARGGLTVAFGRSRLRPWLGTSAMLRARRQALESAGANEGREHLPTFELLVGGGVLFLL